MDEVYTQRGILIFIPFKKLMSREMFLHKFNNAINHLSKMKRESQLYENLTIDMVCAICVCLCTWSIYSTTMMPLDEQHVDVVIQLNIEVQLVDVVFEWKRLFFMSVKFIYSPAVRAMLISHLVRLCV
jgi:hypothetical protein